MMKLKHIEAALSSLQREFPSPNILLEQYPTSAELTACVVFTALQNGDLGPGMTALDLGCGTGMLTVGCALVECDHVFGVDCDTGALVVATQNALDMEMDNRISFLVAQVGHAGTSKPPKDTDARRQKGGIRHRQSSRGGRRSNNRTATLASALILANGDEIPLKDNCVDTVLTNPPFGTKHNAGIDVQFLRTATRLARRSVYSFHKSSTRDYLLRTVAEWGFDVKVVAQMKFDVPNMYKFHQKKSVDIEVDLLRVSHRLEKDDGEEDTAQDERELNGDDDLRDYGVEEEAKPR